MLYLIISNSIKQSFAIGDISYWEVYSRKGIFSFDATVGGDKYELIALPDNPVNIKSIFNRQKLEELLPSIPISFGSSILFDELKDAQ